MKIDRPSIFRNEGWSTIDLYFVCCVFSFVLLEHWSWSTRWYDCDKYICSKQTKIRQHPLNKYDGYDIWQFFIRVSVSPLWQHSPVYQSVPPTLKIPFVNRKHRICVQRSCGFLFCFGRCVSRTYTSAYWERNARRNETKTPAHQSTNRWSEDTV